MAPLAFIQCVLYAYVSGELDHVRHYSAHEMTPFKATALLANGAIAFGLNVVSFTANKKAGALSMTVAGACHCSSHDKTYSCISCRKCEAGVDDIIRGDHLRPDDNQYERAWHPAHSVRWRVVCNGRLSRKEKA